jgi:UDP-N-acetylglucosamine/UDP-N-acetylgalactosamine diphosphorylase
MINQKPIFLGGQGGMAGPVKINYGSVIAAGTIVRKDVLKENILLLGHSLHNRTISFTPGLYTNIRRIIRLNTEYIANIIVLRRWYLDVRSRFEGAHITEKALFEGAVEKISYAFKERIKRLGEVAARMPQSVAILKKDLGDTVFHKGLEMKMNFFKKWPDIEGAFIESLNTTGDASKRDEFLASLEKAVPEKGNVYLDVIQGLTAQEAEVGTQWLRGIIKEIQDRISKII